MYMSHRSYGPFVSGKGWRTFMLFFRISTGRNVVSTTYTATFFVYRNFRDLDDESSPRPRIGKSRVTFKKIFDRIRFFCLTQGAPGVPSPARLLRSSRTRFEF